MTKKTNTEHYVYRDIYVLGKGASLLFIFILPKLNINCQKDQRPFRIGTELITRVYIN